jgi:o-succinylbenzoate synthase
MSKISLRFHPHELLFHFEAGTSRGVLTKKKSYFVELSDGVRTGIGEAGPLFGLSPEFSDDCTAAFEKALQPFQGLALPTNIQEWITEIPFEQPSFRFALETAYHDLTAPFTNKFAQGEKSLPINGLIWMGSAEFMREQIEQKLAQGYSCLKLKIGAIDFDTELSLLKSIRSRFSKEELILRVDANGAFSPAEAPYKLEKLAAYDLHSIEQPIKAGQPEEMKKLVAQHILPIALDEELIGMQDKSIATFIDPDYIILKPSFLGGIQATRDWINWATEKGKDWWITSALESNIGLQAIAQFTGDFDIKIPQGLGTGQLYTNNFGSGLSIEKGNILFDPTFPRESPFQPLSL